MTQISSSKLLSSALTALGAIAEVLVPEDDGYAGTAATLFADGTPDLVVRPLDAAGVAAALRYAADTGLAVTVRSGGHSMAGLSTSADGMIIDTRRISGVRLLDPASGRVRVGAGATWGAVAAALSPLGLGLTAGDTNQVGVGGLTLGGGIGWMVRRHGLAIDSLAAAQVVTADGRLIGADAVEHADLFWALRGGGGNFGVAAGFDFTAQPVTSVHFGTIGYQAGDVPRLIAGWRDLMRTSDEKLTTTLNLMPAVPGRPGRISLACCYASPDADEAAEALRPFRALAPVTSDGIRAMPYAEVLEDMTPLPPGLRMEVRNAFFTALDDARDRRRRRPVHRRRGGARAAQHGRRGRARQPGRDRFRPPGRRSHARGGLPAPAARTARAAAAGAEPVVAGGRPGLGRLRRVPRFGGPRGRRGGLPAGHLPAPGGSQAAL